MYDKAYDKASLREAIDMLLTALQSLATLIYAGGILAALGSIFFNDPMLFGQGFMVSGFGIVLNLLIATLRIWTAPLKSRSFLTFFLP